MAKAMKLMLTVAMVSADGGGVRVMSGSVTRFCKCLSSWNFYLGFGCLISKFKNPRKF